MPVNARGGPPIAEGVQLLWRKQSSSFLLRATLQVMVRSDPPEELGDGEVRARRGGRETVLWRQHAEKEPRL